MEKVNFGQAIEALKQGKRVAREGWNGKGMFIFERPADTIPVQTVIENVKLIPDSVKLFLHNKYRHDYVGASGEVFKINFESYLCLYTANGNIMNGWTPNTLDTLANDWVILD